MRKAMHVARTALGLVVGAGVIALLPAGPASAHEQRTVGRYSFVVGFGDEPA